MLPPETTGDLALQVVRQHAAAFLEHTSAVTTDDDPRVVHQARVATRRMRAALRLFEDVLPAESATMYQELAWIAAELGTLRDLDVQVLRLRRSAVDLGVSEALVPYGAWLEDRRQRARRELDDALKSIRFQHLVEQLQGLNAWAPVREADSPLVQDGPRRLKRAFKKLKIRAERIDDDSPSSDLHRVRIGAKRLRYTAEFFEAMYGKPAQRLVERSVALQDLLGDLQDGVVSRQHIHEAVQTAGGTWPAETSLALGQIIQYDAQRSAGVRSRFHSVYEDLRDRAWKRLASKVAMS